MHNLLLFLKPKCMRRRQKALEKGQPAEPLQIGQREVDALLMPEPGQKPLLTWAAARRVLLEVAGEGAAFATVRSCRCRLLRTMRLRS